MSIANSLVPKKTDTVDDIFASESYPYAQNILTHKQEVSLIPPFSKTF